MTDSDSNPTDAGKAFASAWAADGDEKQAKLAEATEALRVEMEALSAKVANLIVKQPPLDLLGYLWSRFFIDVSAHAHASGSNEPDKELIQKNQFAMEYVHAVLSGVPPPAKSRKQLKVEDVAEMFATLDELMAKTMQYVMASSMMSANAEFGASSRDVEFQAKSTWVLIRGHRYQVLEEEFFGFVLAPHDDMLTQTYGIGAAEIAAGIQAIVTSMSRGLWTAVDKLETQMNATHSLMDAEGISMDEAVERLRAQDPNFDADAGGAIQDMLFGGMTNLSRHTKLPALLLDDLSYERGQNTEFFGSGDLTGTPMRTLPARIRPLVKLNGEVYAPDGQFVRDAAYRAIQRGLLARVPAYREQWKERQTTLIEEALPTILSAQFAQSKVLRSVYYKDVDNKQWAETDLVITLADILVIAEAKGGVGAMGSPVTNFQGHTRAVRDLVTKAYDQCKRFLRYLASQTEAPLYELVEGEYIEVGRLRLADYRAVFPLGLTVESFTPFSAMCKELPGIDPILGKYPFVSMSVDDLFVLNRFLPTAGELFHYLEVRQQVAGIPKAHLFDELDHLGAYITENRFDEIIRDQLKEADLIAWDSFSGTVDRYFEQDRWKTEPPPSQAYPKELAKILEALDRSPSALRFLADSHLRNRSGAAREEIAKVVRELTRTLPTHPMRRALLGGEEPLLLWVCRGRARPSEAEVVRQGEIACLAVRQSRVLVLAIGTNANLEPNDATPRIVTAPPMIRSDYFELLELASQQRAKFQKIKKK